MKKALFWLLGIACLVVVGAYVFTKFTNSSLKLQTIDLSVDCSDVNRFVLTSTVKVKVQNLSSRNHGQIMVRISAYDKRDNLIKEKTTTFERTLLSNGSLSKNVAMPGKTRRCECLILSSVPE